MEGRGLVNGEGEDTMTAEYMAYRNKKIQQEKMELYRKRFEDDMSVNYHDMWNYIANKIANNGENIFNANPQGGAKHAQAMNEAVEIKTLTEEL